MTIFNLLLACWPPKALPSAPQVTPLLIVQFLCYFLRFSYPHGVIGSGVGGGGGTYFKPK